MHRQSVQPELFLTKYRERLDKQERLAQSTLFLENFFSDKEKTHNEREALLREFIMAHKTANDNEEESDQSKKEELMDDFGLKDQYYALVRLLEIREKMTTIHPYRSARHSPVPSYQEVLSRISIDDLENISLFYEPLLIVEPYENDWMIFIIDAVYNNQLNYMEQPTEKVFSEYVSEYMDQVRILANKFRYSLNSIFNIFY